MTIDEAINIIKSDNKFNKSIGCNISFEEQLAEWLEELKELRDMKDTITSNAEVLIKQGYDKGIDDFIHECDKYCGFYSGDNKNLTREAMLSIAGQLKEGGTDE